MRITVVTGTYNRKQALIRMLDSARASVADGMPLDFVLVDGGSTDGTLEWIKEHQSQYRIDLIEHGQLYGAVRAFTDGAKAVRPETKYVILANDDILFRRDSILRAVLHLEMHSSCGAVAFADNRESFGKVGYSVMGMAAMKSGRPVTVAYAQVGMYRHWLGDAAGWWGADDPAFTARTYGADNYLSSRIWEIGYTVDSVPGVEVDDFKINDTLREINGMHAEDGQHPDSAAYFKRFPTGAKIPDEPTMSNPDREQLRILYLPVYEPGYPVQKEQKTGLRDALNKRFFVYEVDFLSYHVTELYDKIAAAIETFKPHMMLSQIQADEPMNESIVRRIRALSPSMVWVNWNGDVYPGGLTAQKMLDLLKWVDLQLTVNADVLPVYAANNIPAGYWQIGYEDPEGETYCPNLYGVVFLANAYTPQRKALEDVLLSTGASIGLWGSGWEHGQGFNLYDFKSGRAIYQSAKIALGDNQFNTRGFVSNRMFQAMAAGNCLYLQQVVPELEERTGYVHGKHYIAWKTPEDLKEKIQYYLSHEDERARIANAGTLFTHEHHSFEARVTELFKNLLPLAKRRPREFVTLNYKGSRSKPFGIDEYGMYTPGQLLRLPDEQARLLLMQYPDLWERVESEMG